MHSLENQKCHIWLLMKVVNSNHNKVLQEEPHMTLLVVQTVYHKVENI